MATTQDLMAMGLPAGVAVRLGDTLQAGITAAGSTTADATALTGTVCVIGTAAASTGVKLREAGTDHSGLVFVYNGGANTVSVYPATGETINGGSADAAVTIAAGKVRLFIVSGYKAWHSMLGA